MTEVEQEPGTRPKGRNGFASMTPERRRELASQGGKAAHAYGTAHEWTPEEAQAAGRKGGKIGGKASKRKPIKPEVAQIVEHIDTAFQTVDAVVDMYNELARSGKIQ